MADLSDLSAAQSVKIIGSSSTGIEGTPVASDALGNLNVQTPSVRSLVNSTSTPLSTSGVFVGTGEEVLDFAMITVQVFADQASATLGFKPQYSIDNTNWDDGDAYTVAAGDGRFFTFPVQARYFRIMYTNSATVQTVFRLQTIFHRSYVKPSSHRIGDTLNDDNDSELVKAIVTGRRADATYDNLQLTNNNELRTADFINTGAAFGPLTVGVTAVAVNLGANLANRKSLTIYNNGTVTIYWGPANTVTVSTGMPIPRGASVSIDAGFPITIYLISGTASQNVRFVEFA